MQGGIAAHWRSYFAPNLGKWWTPSADRWESTAKQKLIICGCNTATSRARWSGTLRVSSMAKRSRSLWCVPGWSAPSRPPMQELARRVPNLSVLKKTISPPRRSTRGGLCFFLDFGYSIRMRKALIFLNHYGRDYRLSFREATQFWH